MMRSFTVENFSLQQTLESGQFFLYESYNDWYYLITTERVCKVRQRNNKIFYDNITKEDLQQFLGLLVPYEHIITKLRQDPVLCKYISLFPGLRVMRLDPWQCLVSFLCSSASNIPKIRTNLFSLSKTFGKKVHYDGHLFYLFPKQGKLGTLQEIMGCGVGFRAPYITATNKIPSALFTSLPLLPYDEAKEHLCMHSGVGDKIADCILLFAYHKWQAFPIDVWIERALIQHYTKKKRTGRQLQQLVKTHFPHYPGYAQQFLYHGIRMQNRL